MERKARGKFDGQDGKDANTFGGQVTFQPSRAIP